MTPGLKVICYMLDQPIGQFKTVAEISEATEVSDSAIVARFFGPSAPGVRDEICIGKRSGVKGMVRVK